MRLKHIKNAEEIISKSKYLVKSPRENKGNWNKVFNNDNNIEVEIGMGKGKFIIEKAIQNPNINYIGIEKYDSPLVSAVKKLEELEINNLKLICIDALGIEEVFNHEIDKIYLNFSDPWPKKKHAKRRLTSPKFLDEYKKILKLNGQIEFKTDNRGLFEYSLVSMQNYGLKFIEVYLDLHKTDIFNIETEYEKKFSPFGPIYKIVVEY